MMLELDRKWRCLASDSIDSHYHSIQWYMLKPFMADTVVVVYALSGHGTSQLYHSVSVSA